MRYFKDTKDGFYAVENTSVNIPADFVEISIEEAEILTANSVDQLDAIVKATKDAADAQAAKDDSQLSAIVNMTPSQASQWIENNVTNLTEAKNALKIMAKAICILARRI